MKKLLLTTNFILGCIISDGYTSLSKVRYEVDEELTQEQLNRKYPETADYTISPEHEKLLAIALQLKNINWQLINNDQKLLKELARYPDSVLVCTIDPKYSYSKKNLSVKDAKEYLNLRLKNNSFNHMSLFDVLINLLEENISLPQYLDKLITNRQQYLKNRFNKFNELCKQYGYNLTEEQYLFTAKREVTKSNFFNQQNIQQIINYFNSLNIMIKETFTIINNDDLTDYSKWCVNNLPVLNKYLQNTNTCHPDPDSSFKDVEPCKETFYQFTYDKKTGKSVLTNKKDSYADYLINNPEDKEFFLTKEANHLERKNFDNIERKLARKKLSFKNKQEKQADQLRIAQEQEHRQQQILEARRLKNTNNNGNTKRVVQPSNIIDDVYFPNNNGQSSRGEKFKIEETKSKLKTRGRAYESSLEEKPGIIVEEKRSFEIKYISTRLHKKFMKFWDSSAGTTYTNLKIWTEALGVTFREDTGSSHVHAYYTDDHGKTHHMVTTNHHSQDAYGKGTTSSMKKFFAECGLTPEYVLLNKEQSK